MLNLEQEHQAKYWSNRLFRAMNQCPNRRCDAIIDFKTIQDLCDFLDKIQEPNDDGDGLPNCFDTNDPMVRV